MILDNNQKAFLALVRAGLWEQDVQLSTFDKIDLKEIYRLAQEQSVVGLVAVGLEKAKKAQFPKEDVLTVIGDALQFEQRNIAMNYFIGVIVDKMRKAGINTILLKGQGIAQCYERPLWRACGDVDLLFSEDCYQSAIDYLTPKASKFDAETSFDNHYVLLFDQWEVELHGRLRAGLWNRVENGLNDIRDSIFHDNNVRLWNNGQTKVFLPRADEDVVYVFDHILQHFFNGGIGLRQICDWCRLLWTYKDSIDRALLEERINKMGIMSEWKAFAAFAIEKLGAPVEAMQFYSLSKYWKRKADLILTRIMEMGNFGHNKDYRHIDNQPFLKRKIRSFSRHTFEALNNFRLFPVDALRVWLAMLETGLKAALCGKV